MGALWVRLLLVAWGLIALSGCSTINGWVDGVSDTYTSVSHEEFTSEFAPKVLWSSSIGSGTDGLWVELSHQIVGERVYVVAADGVVSAVDISSGGNNWQQTIKESVITGVAVGGGDLYVGTESGTLLALDRVSGKQHWSVPLLSEILAPPAVSSGVVVVRTVDGKLIGLSEESGREIWRYQREVPVLTLRGTSSPIIADGRVYAGMDSGEVVALALQDGRELWLKSVTPARGRTEIERMVDIDADPVILDGVIYIVSYQGNLAALGAEQGDLLWKRKMSGVTAPMVYGPYLFVADTEGNVWALDRKDGSALWKQDGLKGRNLTTPTLSGLNLVVGDDDGYLHWISAEDGHFVARMRVDSTGVSATPLLGSRTIISYGQSGKLSAIIQQ